MCTTCNELDQKIANYNRMATQITDAQTSEAIAGLIKELAAEKAALKCGPDAE